MKFLGVFAFALGMSMALSQRRSRCPPNLPMSVAKHDLDGACYAFFSAPNGGDYLYARSKCNDYGGLLALPKTLIINTILASTLKDQLKSHRSVWIGLNDIDEEGVFVWEDGTPLNISTDYDNFKNRSGGPRAGFTSHNVKDCVFLRPDGYWRDDYCGWSDERDFICQFDSPAPKSPPTQKTTHPATLPTIQTTAQTSKSTANPSCPPFTSCDVKCGLSGYKKDPVDGCFICVCND